MSFFVNFFTKLGEIAKDVDLTFRIKEKNGRYTVLVQPELANANKVKALRVTGTPAELDESFFGEVEKSMTALEGLSSNAQEVVDDAATVKALVKEPAPKAAKKGQSSDKGGKKKPAKDDKPVRRKKPTAEPEPAQRDIFSQEAPQEPPQSETSDPDPEAVVTDPEDVTDEPEEGEADGSVEEESE
jgi:PRTRC genetic system protein E